MNSGGIPFGTWARGADDLQAPAETRSVQRQRCDYMCVLIVLLCNAVPYLHALK